MNYLEVKTRASIANSRRLIILGDYDSAKYELVRHLVNPNLCNRKILIFTDKCSINSVVGRGMSDIRSIDTKNGNGTNIRGINNYNVFYNIKTIKILDTWLSSINCSNSIVILDGFDDVLNDTKFANKRSNFSNIVDVFENADITPILISDDFPQNKYKLISIYNFDFVFFSKIPESGSLNSKCTQLRKLIFGSTEILEEFKNCMTFKGITEFIYLKYTDQDLYRGTCDDDEDLYPVLEDERNGKRNKQYTIDNVYDELIDNDSSSEESDSE